MRLKKVLQENCKADIKQYDGSYSTCFQEHMVFKGQQFLVILIIVLD